MEKFTQEQYADIIRERKFETQNRGELYIEMNCKTLMEELEPKAKNLTVCSKALLDALLEGDRILEAPKTKNKCGGALTVRYYCDNLSPERAKYTCEPEF